ncbi:hypothetical protein [Geodermatophilus sp. SYSU D00766]
MVLTTRSGPSSPTPDAAAPRTEDRTAGEPLRGWQLSAHNTGLAPFGLSCGDLPRYTGSIKPPPGSVISEVRITESLDLSNADITIDKSCVQPTSIGSGMPILTTTDFNRCSAADGCPVSPGPVTITNSEIDGSLLDAQAGAFTTGFLGIADLRNNYVHDVGSGIAIMNAGHDRSSLIERNYVTRLRAYGDGATTGNHSDAFTVRDFDSSRSGDRRLVVRDNRFDCSSGNDTGALFVQALAGDIDNLTVTGNLLEGGGYQLGLNQDGGHTYANLAAVDNRFSGTGYGPAYVQGGTGWSEWADNYLHDPGRADTRGKPLGAP